LKLRRTGNGVKKSEGAGFFGHWAILRWKFHQIDQICDGFAEIDFQKFAFFCLFFGFFTFFAKNNRK